MSSTFSPTLRIELIGDGDQSGIWGQTTNSNLGTLIEQAITGVQNITMLDANYTLSNFNGVADEARNAVLVIGGVLTQQRNLIAPLVEKTYIVKNSTTGGFGVQIGGSSGTGVVIPNGQTMSVYCDGTDFYTTLTGTAGNFRVAGNLAVIGTTALTGALSGSTATFAGAISSVSPSFTGTPTAPTATTGTNTTQIATTAFVNASTTALGLGTMSTQNANAVNITGGTMTGMTTVAGGAHSGTTATFSGAVSGASGAFSGAVSGTTGTFSGAMSAASLAGGASTGSGASGTWAINVSGNAATATNATNATNSTNATNLTGGTMACSSGSITSGAPTLWFYDTDQADFACHVNSNLWYVLNQGGSGIMYVDQSGNFTANGNVTAYSDERLKTNWRPVQDGFVEKLANIKSGVFDRTDIEATQIGVSAQSLQGLMPEAIQADKDGMLTVNYGAAAMVAVIELAKQVESLKAEIAELKRGK